MGQWKVWISFSWSIGVRVEYEPSTGVKSLKVQIPFFQVYFGLTEHASGICVFNKRF